MGYLVLIKQHVLKKPRLWLFLGERARSDVHFVIPTVAWLAEAAGASFEIYLESHRTGQLFAEHGSTVLGGHHHQQFNYLCGAFQVEVIRFGETKVFDSSIHAFDLPVIADTLSITELYRQLLQRSEAKPQAIVFGPVGMVGAGIEIGPYLFPEILYRKALAAPAREASALRTLAESVALPVHLLLLEDGELAQVRADFPTAEVSEKLGTDEGWAQITLRLALRWKGHATGVVFGDPPAILSQLGAHCRHRRVALYAPAQKPAPAQVKASWYTESVSPLAAQAAKLAVDLGERIIAGRQTGDGDIFEWSKQGVSIQIIDPNRPPFPIVSDVGQTWSSATQPRPAVEEPSDEQLITWADEGRVLTTLLFHSGEVAHNEAMLALVELAAWSGARFGVGVHAQRYESCPQMWELLSVDPDHGGARGLVEPVLHSGGLGVMAECNFPPDLLRANCQEAIERIRSIAGAPDTPIGYYAFMDSNHDRLDQVRPDLFRAIADAGLRFIVSSALPGRNRVLWRSGDDRCRALNQTPRVVEGTSPFVRATTPEDLANTVGSGGAGWIIATLDAPVISFAPYIWKKGSRFMDMVKGLTSRNRINVLPRTIARYARLLEQRGVLPPPTV